VAWRPGSKQPSMVGVPVVLFIIALVGVGSVVWYLHSRSKPALIEEYLFTYDKTAELGTWKNVLPVSVMNLENHTIDKFLLNMENYPDIFNYVPSIRVCDENWVFLPYDVRENAKAIAVLDNLAENETKTYYILWDNPIAKDNQIYIAISGETIQLTYLNAVYYTQDVQYYYSNTLQSWVIRCNWGTNIDWVLPKSSYEISIWWGTYGGWGDMYIQLENGTWVKIASALNYNDAVQLRSDSIYRQKFTTPEIVGLRICGQRVDVVEPIYAQSLTNPYNLLLSFGMKSVSSFRLDWDNDSITILENQKGLLTGSITNVNCKGRVGVMVPKWGNLEGMLAFKPMVTDIEPNMDVRFTLLIENTTGKVGSYYIPIILYDNRTVDVSVININIVTPSVQVPETVLPENAQALFEWFDGTLVPVMENYFNDPELKNMRLEFNFNYAKHEYHMKVRMERRKDGKIEVWIKEEEFGAKPFKERYYIFPS
jgi:hypothetical protein